MQDKLLRILIKEILTEDDGGGDITPSDSAYGDIPRVDHYGNAIYQTGYHGTGGGPFSGGGTLFKPLGDVANAVYGGVKDVGGAALNAGAKFAAISWIFNNPWSATIMGGNWIDHYLDSVGKGTTGQVTLQAIKTAAYQKFNIPAIAGAIKISGIPLLIKGVSIGANIAARQHGVGPIVSQLSNEINKLSNNLPSMPDDLKKVFSHDENTKHGMENYLYKVINDLKKGKKSGTPIDNNLSNIISMTRKLIKSNPSLANRNNLYQHFITNGIDQETAEELTKLIIFVNK